MDPKTDPIAVPDGSLVVLVGPSGSGKSTFATRHFRPTEILASDRFRAMIADDEANQAASRHAFELLHRVAFLRLRARRTTVVDATNVSTRARRDLLALAAATRRPAIAIVFDLPLEAYHDRNLGRWDRVVDPQVVERQARELRRSLLAGRLEREGFRSVHVLAGPRAIDAARIERLPPAIRSRPIGPPGRTHGP